MYRWLLVFLWLPANAWAIYSLPSTRSVTWQGNVGVSGDIPAQTQTIYATISPSGGDDTSTIQTTLNNCPSGQVVKLNAGTFKISSVTMGSNVVLRGSGIGTTILQGRAPAVNYLLYMHISDKMATSVTLRGGLTKGSTTIATSTPHGWSAGDIILIDQLNNSSADPPVTNTGNNGTCRTCGRNGRSMAQINKITSVPDPTHATLEIPLYHDFSGSTPQGTKFTSVVFNSGVEDLTVDNSISGGKAQDGWGTVDLSFTSNCWLSNVESIGSYQSGIFIKAAYRNTVRGCKVHEGVPYSGRTPPGDGTVSYDHSRAYGISFMYYNSANLVENNRIYHETAGILVKGANSGNVFAYNYIHDMYYSDTTWLNYPFTFHGAHPMMNLIEGNYVVGRMVADNTRGSASHNTFFRNRVVPPAGRNKGVWDFAVEKNSWYFNYLGNVAGAGTETVYELNNVDTADTVKSIYKLGYDGDGDQTASGNDSGVGSSILRHGNWDSLNNGVVWNGSDDRGLPASLYLAAKPAWMGTGVHWPPIGPDITPTAPNLPADGSSPFSSRK